MESSQQPGPSEQLAANLALSSQMQRVRAASLGEVILLNVLDHNSLSNLMPDFGYDQPPVSGVLFHGMLGIYDGLPTLGTFIRVGDEEVTLELNRKHNYELALINQGGLVVPFIRPPHGTAMSLDDRAYMGPEEISAVLKEQCGGHFDRFFENYVRVHRKV